MKFSNRMPAGKTFNATFLRPFGLILACLALCLSACGGGGGGYVRRNDVGRVGPPSCNRAVTPANGLFMPGAGGKCLSRAAPASVIGGTQPRGLLGGGAYNGARAGCDSPVCRTPPLPADAQGNVYFGFIVTGSN